jgi:hypothetical protein
MMNDLIDAEIVLTETSDLQSSSSSSPITTKEDDRNEEIILLDDDSNDESGGSNSVTVSVEAQSSKIGDNSSSTSSSNANITSSIDTNNHDDTTTTNNNSADNSTIHVESNLKSMSNEELIAICTERGYEISVEDDDDSNNDSNASVLTHDDYVNAAMQCLSLDKVVNQMIADDPDIAADMDYEVERIRHEKEKLQQEQESILQEISSLEEELRASGIDPTSIAVGGNTTGTTSTGNSSTITTTTTTSPSTKVTSSVESASFTKINMTDMTVDEVLRESFVQLFDRVGKDIQFVARIVQHMLVQPTVTSLSLIWRYTSPTLNEAVVRPLRSCCVQYVIPPLQQALKPIQPHINPIRQRIQHQYTILMDVFIQSRILQQHHNYGTVIQSQIQQWYHQQREEIQLGIRIIGAFIVPLYQSLMTGYRIFLQPFLHNATITTKKFLSQLQLQQPEQ